MVVDCRHGGVAEVIVGDVGGVVEDVESSGGG